MVTQDQGKAKGERLCNRTGDCPSAVKVRSKHGSLAGRIFGCALLLCLPLAAQTFYRIDDVTRSGIFIGEFERLGIRECNGGDQPLVVNMALFYWAMGNYKISVATYTELQAVNVKEEGMSPERKALAVAEAAGYIANAVIVLIPRGEDGEPVIRERWARTLIAVGPPAIRIGTTLIKPPKVKSLPPMRQPIVHLAPGECKESAAYGKDK